MSFQKGDVVCIFNSKMSGEPLFEGRATIIKPTGVPDQYRVRFNDGMEHGEYTRFVYPGPHQADPDAYLAAVKREWHERELARAI